MTPQGIEYVKALLEAAPGSIEHNIGQRIWELSRRDEILKCVNVLMCMNPENSREYEIAWDVWILIADVRAIPIPSTDRNRVLIEAVTE